MPTCFCSFASMRQPPRASPPRMYGAPWNAISPRWMPSRPIITRSSELLPLPLGPMITSRSSARMSRLMPSITTRFGPYDLCTSRSRTKSPPGADAAKRVVERGCMADRTAVV